MEIWEEEKAKWIKGYFKRSNVSADDLKHPPLLNAECCFCFRLFGKPQSPPNSMYLKHYRCRPQIWERAQPKSQEKQTKGLKHSRADVETVVRNLFWGSVLHPKRLKSFLTLLEILLVLICWKSKCLLFFSMFDILGNTLFQVVKSLLRKMIPLSSLYCKYDAGGNSQLA